VTRARGRRRGAPWLYSRRVAADAKLPPRPSRRTTPTLLVTADGSRTLHSSRYGESYHSVRGALTEARHVYLEASGVAARLAAGRTTTVLEVGFGTGLNALVTIAAAQAAGASLRYVSLERELLSADVLAGLDYRSLFEDPAAADALIACRRAYHPASDARFQLDLGGARLEVVAGDARHARLPRGVHAVYHDAFSPGVNPELWQAPFLTKLFDALEPAAALVSYTVQGALRRRLAEIGFAVVKAPGPARGKREMLIARKSGGREREPTVSTPS